MQPWLHICPQHGGDVFALQRKDTIVWVAIPGLAPLFGFTAAAKHRGYYQRAILQVASMTALVEFYLNLASFPLLAELVLVPVSILLALLSTVAGLRPEQATVKSWIDRALAALGLLVIVATGVMLISGQVQLDPRELLLQFGAPIWLTAAAVPFIFIFSLYANYEGHFLRIDGHARDDPKARRRAKLALLTTYGARNHELAGFSGIAYSDLVRATTWREARRVVAYRRAEARAEEARKDFQAARLVRYEGVAGTDWDGRPFDEREFAETKAALEFLASVHRARREKGRFRKDLMQLVKGAVSRTLRDEDFAMKVAQDGRSWYASRRTVGGWYLGIGAAGDPHENWTYLGEREPDRFPGPTSGWAKGEFRSAINLDE
jgi:hypothetical protein